VPDIYQFFSLILPSGITKGDRKGREWQLPPGTADDGVQNCLTEIFYDNDHKSES